MSRDQTTDAGAARVPRWRAWYGLTLRFLAATIALAAPMIDILFYAGMSLMGAGLLTAAIVIVPRVRWPRPPEDTP